jgi:hypothetical protein
MKKKGVDSSILKKIRAFFEHEQGPGVSTAIHPMPPLITPMPWRAQQSMKAVSGWLSTDG